MESHQKNGSANGKILDYISQNFRYPKDFASLLYISQVLQGMAIKFGVEHWRRNRGRCMGAIYWQVNDNWPVASWSSIDYYGRWKALHYMAKKFYAPVALSIRKEGTTLEVWLANETKEPVAVAQASISMKKTDFSVLSEGRGKGIVVAPYTSVCLLKQDVAEFAGLRDVFAEAKVVLEDGRLFTETETLVPYKHMELCRPEFKVKVSERETAYEIRLTGNTFAPFVGLDFTDADVIFSDNFFSVSEAKPVVVTINKTDIRNGSFQDAEDVKNRLQITTVADTY
jgi:beta-mannosidase